MRTIGQGQKYVVFPCYYCYYFPIMIKYCNFNTREIDANALSHCCPSTLLTPVMWLPFFWTTQRGLGRTTISKWWWGRTLRVELTSDILYHFLWYRNNEIANPVTIAFDCKQKWCSLHTFKKYFNFEKRRKKFGSYLTLYIKNW